MTELRRVPISSFLKERESRIKPDEANKLGLRRLEKSIFQEKFILM